MSLRCFLLLCCSSLQSPNLLPEPPRPLPYLKDLTAVLSSAETSTRSVLTSPSGTNMTISPGSSALIGKSRALHFVLIKNCLEFRLQLCIWLPITVNHLVTQPWSTGAKDIKPTKHCQSESLSDCSQNSEAHLKKGGPLISVIPKAARRIRAPLCHMLHFVT